jgi:hypothetical protein
MEEPLFAEAVSYRMKPGPFLDAHRAYCRYDFFTAFFRMR